MTSNDESRRPGADTPAHPAPEPVVHTPTPPGTPDSPRQTTAVRIRRTRISGIWVAVIVAAIILILLLVFILQNLAEATVYYFGAAGSLPLGVALLLATVGGALLVGLIGTARILQLRRLATKHRAGHSPGEV
jgi:uncharacterized integral membrane protein